MAKELKTESTPQPAAPPEIKTNQVTAEWHGHTSKSMVVTVGPDFQLQWLNDYPQIWKLVQADRSGKALAEFDSVEIRHPEWVANARVNYASADKVHLFDIRKASKPQRDLALFSDEHFEVRWAANGYTYHRKADGVGMTSASWATPEAAKAALFREQYSKAVA